MIIMEQVSIKAAPRESVIELGEQLDQKMIEVELKRSLFIIVAEMMFEVDDVGRCRRDRRGSAKRDESFTPSALMRSHLLLSGGILYYWYIGGGGDV